MIFGRFERLMAGRYLRARRRQGVISLIALFSLLGITLGVATLIIVLSVMNGFRQELMVRILGLEGHVTVFYPQGDVSALQAELTALPGVDQVIPMVTGQALVTMRGKASGAMLWGMDPADLAGRPLLAEGFMAPGDMITRQRMDYGLEDYTKPGPAEQARLREGFSGDKIALGWRMAVKLGLDIGDSIILVSPRLKNTPFGQIPMRRHFEIGAVFDTGMSRYDGSYLFLPLAAARSFLEVPDDTVEQLDIQLAQPDQVEAMSARIRQLVSARGQVRDWRQLNVELTNALEVERNVMFLILTLIILVASFNIISSLIMLVQNKSRDIAILRSMGATRGAIQRIFILTGASVGVFGTVLGVALGVIFTFNIEQLRRWLEGLLDVQLFSAEIYFLSTLPAKLDWTEVGYIAAMALGLSFLATLYPSWKAARLDPVEVLRYE